MLRQAAAEAKAAEEEAEVAAAAASEAGKSKKKKKKKKGKTNAPEPSLPLPSPKKERTISMDDASDASSDEEDLLMLVGGGGGGSKQAGKKVPGGKGSASTPVDSAGQSKTSTPATSNQPSPKGSPLLKAKDQKSKISSSGGPVKDDDADDLSLLTEFVQTRDVAAIEALMESLKGVPGKAAIRKNAKKALKKAERRTRSELQRSFLCAASAQEEGAGVGREQVDVEEQIQDKEGRAKSFCRSIRYSRHRR